MNISTDRRKFIKAHFNETSDPVRKEFEQLTTSVELHEVATTIIGIME